MWSKHPTEWNVTMFIYWKLSVHACSKCKLCTHRFHIIISRKINFHFILLLCHTHTQLSMNCFTYKVGRNSSAKWIKYAQHFNYRYQKDMNMPSAAASAKAAKTHTHTHLSFYSQFVWKRHFGYTHAERDSRQWKFNRNWFVAVSHAHVGQILTKIVLSKTKAKNYANKKNVRRADARTTSFMKS